MMCSQIFQSLLFFIQCIVVGNWLTVAYRFICSFTLFRNVSWSQHIRNIANAEPNVPFSDLILGSILEEIVFRSPLLFSQHAIFLIYSVIGFGLMHFVFNRSNYEKNIFAFGEVIATSFFGYACVNSIEILGLYGFILNCLVHTVMNLCVVSIQKFNQDKKKIIYVDCTGVAHSYLNMHQSIFCHLFRRIVQ